MMTRACSLLAVLALVFPGIGEADDGVSIKNPGFETAGPEGRAEDWNGVANVYSRDTAVKRSGEAALKGANTNPDDYQLCTQSIVLEPGQMYRLRAWVKTQGVQGDESGATVCMEWSDGEGKYLGGHYPPGLKGDHDWTEINAVSSRVPENAKGFTVTCYLRQGITGTAWWDDVSIERARENPLSCVLVEPNYRAQVTDAGPENLRIRAFVQMRDYEQGLAGAALHWRLVALPEEKMVNEAAVDPIPDETTDVVIPARSLPPGPYRAVLDLKDKKTGEVLATASAEAKRVAGTPERKTYIDAHNRLMLDGKPFFPLGMYWSRITPEEIGSYADSPFNCLMPYSPPDRDQMDLAQARGLKVIYSVKDTYFGSACEGGITKEEDEATFVKAKVEAFRDHPALLAWYINDELGLELLPRLAAHRQWIEDLDPGHPAWVVLYQVDQIRDYLPSFDVIGTDPYPLPSRPVSMAGEWTRKTVQGVTGARAVWQVPQVFNWANYAKTDAEKKDKRPPTLEEMRCMAWQCIAEGANGLVFYSWFDIRKDPSTPFEEQWTKVKTMAQEIKDMIPVLLSVETPPELALPSEPWLNACVKQLDGVTYLIAVNNTAQAQSVAVQLPKRPQSAVVRGTGKIVEIGENNVIRLDLAPMEVRIAELRWNP